MRLEYIVGGVIVAVLLAGVALYVRSDSLDAAVNNERHVSNDEKNIAVEGDVIPAKDMIKTLETKSRLYPKAPEITKAEGYLNTEGKPMTISEFKGKKVVLIDFWTYSCINCQRTLPYVNAWYEKYKDDGLVVIGVHTPEFSFEKNEENVKEALVRLGVKHPVVLDNSFGTWNAFGNQYWPRKYLIDIDGYVVYDHAGEGKYDETERAIQVALAERVERLSASSTVPTDIAQPSGTMNVESSKVGSSETYFGASRNEFLANGTRGKTGQQMFVLPSNISLNRLYLHGSWNIAPEYAEGIVGSEITYKFNSKDVYFVASSKDGAELEILLDGVPLTAGAGSDVSSEILKVKEDRLYSVVSASGYGVHTLLIRVKKGVLDAFTFTFG